MGTPSRAEFPDRSATALDEEAFLQELIERTETMQEEAASGADPETRAEATGTFPFHGRTIILRQV